MKVYLIKIIKLVSNTSILMLLSGFNLVSGQSTDTASGPSQHRNLLNRYCVTCHNETLKTANLMLDTVNIDQVSQDPQTWEKVVTKLTLRAMPPVGMPLRPSEREYTEILSYLTSELDTLAEKNTNPGRLTVHRLNRTEYANAIRDLLSLEIDASKLLPPDNIDQGFDNIAEVLAVSPLLMEQYVLAASKISRLAIGPATMLPVSETYSISQEFLQNSYMGEDLPLGSRGGIAINHYFPMSGEYSMRISLQRNGNGFIRGMRREQRLDVRLDHSQLELLKVGGKLFGQSGPLFTDSQNPDFTGTGDQLAYELTGDKDLEVHFSVDAGKHLVGLTFMDDRAKRVGYLTPELMLPETEFYKGGNAIIDNVVITGPFGETSPGNTPSRERIYICRPQDTGNQESCAMTILHNIAHRAYRRPVSDAEMQGLLEMYQTGEQESGFDYGIELALQRILAGPEFLFRIEKEPANAAPGMVFPISDLDLASRLSFFLWSSIPDDELLAIAEQGQLRNPGVLRGQVERMLRDPRAETLIRNFSDQWLALRLVDQAAPQMAVFPSFDGELRVAMKRELELWVEAMIREDRSVVDMLTSDFTYVNERLARHYGISGIYGDNFRRVSLDTPERTGILGKAGILTVTSFNSRTSPVVRGKWVLENILDMPPPPAPADAFEPELKVESQEGKILTMKEAMVAHRTNPICANCHKMMEPIGLALEIYDGIGTYRTRYDEADAVVDSSGILFDNTEFTDANDFRKKFLKHSDRFVHTVTSKLLTYALGRKLEYNDQAMIRKILKNSADDNYTWSSLILGVIESTPFQYRRTQL